MTVGGVARVQARLNLLRYIDILRGDASRIVVTHLRNTEDASDLRRYD